MFFIGEIGSSINNHSPFALAGTVSTGKMGDLAIYDDVETGCSYLGLVNSGFITPRLRADGTQVCQLGAD
jgi:hypothetical protein